ncbi:DUF2490 domain-containing protein [Mucilaginibacter glaciei]|uniref:DUF2490 domain-containing protein n=1 Tax=Mucilaginibacter glaciei TaxID=2772109 RepID=A0A926S1R3_9SPHI|nr:DUF2490 domain-containing protein [Mucilaginibacter glaciei]MBD1393087.1 DUF2490 domain-containing protein [Mucilaginibacter glaciei]
MKRGILLLLFVAFLTPFKLFAQENQFSGWGAIFHSQRFGKHWGASFDGQFRSASHFDYLRNILLRPSVNYHFDGNKMVALGYAYVTLNGRTASGDKTFRPESRIWQQFTINTKFGSNNTLQHRFRLEQRFLGNTTNTNNHYFAQRLRYFARAIVPFKHGQAFIKGPFAALQDEIFVNVQNKEKVNNHFFDQNRAYAALGYRIRKEVDVEAGYLNQYTKSATAYTINHVIQVAFYTRF